MEYNFILQLYSLPQSVFTLKELILMFPQISPPLLRKRAHYYVKTGKLVRPRSGIYVKPQFNSLELANKIYSPSYISFETVLQEEGLIFQPYDTIYLAAYLSRQITISGQSFHYRKLKSEILISHQGINFEHHYFIASKERAFLDSVLLYKNYHFDNLNPLDWTQVNQLLKIYANKALTKRINQYHEEFKANAK